MLGQAPITPVRRSSPEIWKEVLWPGIATLFLAPRLLFAAAPFSATQLPGSITLTNAVLAGMATPNGAAAVGWFEWGTTRSYGQVTEPVALGNGTRVVRMTAGISNLTAHQTYHYRLVV